jgi:hypothetical protein
MTARAPFAFYGHFDAYTRREPLPSINSLILQEEEEEESTTDLIEGSGL